MSAFLQAHLLIASPYLTDGNFYRSVVLVVEHNQDGAFGLVLNRPGHQAVGEMWEQIMEAPCSIEAPVYIGGPISGPIMLLHDRASEADLVVREGIYFASDKEKIVRLIQDQAARLRVFNGYSGWAAGQLDRELSAGGWLTHPAEPSALFETPHHQLWQRLTQQIGRQITSESLHIRLPDNPSLN